MPLYLRSTTRPFEIDHHVAKAKVGAQQINRYVDEIAVGDDADAQAFIDNQYFKYWHAT